MTPLATAFLILLAVHLCAALVFNLRGRREKPESMGRAERLVLFPVFPFLVILMGRVRNTRPLWLVMAGLQMALFVTACMLGVRAGYFSRDLISPVGIATGLLAAHAIFGVSLLVTHRNVRDILTHLVNLNPLWNYLVEHPRVLTQFFAVATAEEVIYRVGAQPLLIMVTGSPWMGVLAAAIAFSLVHDHFFRNSAGQSLEFLGFSILLGVLFFWTGRLILIIVIHAVRNLEIAFIEHVGRVEETGEEALADCEAEYMAGACSLVLLMMPGRDLPVYCFEYRPERVLPVDGRPAATPI